MKYKTFLEKILRQVDLFECFSNKDCSLIREFVSWSFDRLNTTNIVKKRKKLLTNKKNHVVYDYGKRNINLKSLGFDSYNEYLKSSLWKKVKLKVFSERGVVCEFCGSDKKVVVHHQMYSKTSLNGKKTTQLRVVCGNCHSKIHELEHKKNISVKNATELYELECNSKRERF